jgi:deazaflavin-dependent oxidoreductase (nitroreductase family)
MTFAKFLRSLTRFRYVQPKVGRVHAILLRLSRGRIRRSRLLAGGQPVLALTTVGRRSGTPRTTVVAYVRHGDSYAVGALNLGSDRDPAWCLNLRSNPRAWIQVNGERKAVEASQASGEEAERLWQAFTDRLPTIANSRRLARRKVPMLVLSPVAGAAAVTPLPTVGCRNRPFPFVQYAAIPTKEEAMKYMLLIHQGSTPTPYSPEEWAKLSEEEQKAIYADYQGINETPGVSPGVQMQPPETATTVRVEGEETLTTDGPFVETKEAIGGYLFFEADDLDAAIELAARVPAARLGGAVEVRPVVER